MPDEPVQRASPSQSPAPNAQASPIIGYLAGLGLVAAAGLVAFIVERFIPAPNLSLVFVLPVLVTALAFGWRPALVCVAAAVLTFDVFFIEPRYTLTVAAPSDMWALGLLLVVAAIASTVAAQSRRRALDARLAAERAEALQGVAHLVIEAAPATALAAAASEALAMIFRAPAAVLLESHGGLQPAALAGGAKFTDADNEAARWTLANEKPTRAETYPFDTAGFDFWPIPRGEGRGIVLGVGLGAGRDDRPADADRYVELIGAYLAAGLPREG